MSNQEKNGNNFQSTNPISILGVDGLCVRMAKQVMREEYRGKATIEDRMRQLSPFCQDVCEALRTGNFEKSGNGGSLSIVSKNAMRDISKRIPKDVIDSEEKLDAHLKSVCEAIKFFIISGGTTSPSVKSHVFASSSGNFGYYVKEAARRINRVAEMKGYTEARKIQLATKVFSDVPSEVNNQIGKMKKFADLLSDDEIETEFADTPEVDEPKRVPQQVKKGKK